MCEFGLIDSVCNWLCNWLILFGVNGCLILVCVCCYNGNVLVSRLCLVGVSLSRWLCWLFGFCVIVMRLCCLSGLSVVVSVV